MTKQTKFELEWKRKSDVINSLEMQVREKYDDARKRLDKVQQEFNGVYGRSELLRRIRKNYQDILDSENALGNRIDNANTSISYECYNKLREISQESSRRKLFQDRLVYGYDEQKAISKYVEEASQKLRVRTMNEQEYTFLMNNKPKYLVKYLIKDLKNLSKK